MKKYSPEHIIMATRMRLSSLDEYSKSRPDNFDVFIEIKSHINKWYHIRIAKEGASAVLWEGSFVGANETITGKIFDGTEKRDPMTLFNNKDSLGKVYIKLIW